MPGEIQKKIQESGEKEKEVKGQRKEAKSEESRTVFPSYRGLRADRGTKCRVRLGTRESMNKKKRKKQKEGASGRSSDTRDTNRRQACESTNE